MRLATLLIFITAVWSHVDSASIPKDANYSPHLIGGSPVDEEVPQPTVGILRILNETGEVYKSCGATFIKRKINVASYFITAAECVDKKNNQKLNLRLFFYHSGESYTVDFENFIHPNYNKDTKEHNIAIIRNQQKLQGITAQAELSEKILPAGQPVEVFFWKNVTEDRKNWDLFSIKTETINSESCRNSYPSSPIKENLVCASGWKGKGLEKNNVGAPLIQRDPENNKRFLMIGMATLVRPEAAATDSPMEFVDLSMYQSWLKSVLPA